MPVSPKPTQRDDLPASRLESESPIQKDEIGRTETSEEENVGSGDNDRRPSANRPIGTINKPATCAKLSGTLRTLNLFSP